MENALPSARHGEQHAAAVLSYQYWLPPPPASNNAPQRKPSRRRSRVSKMDSLPQQVCVVRSADPVFCPHNAYGFISPLEAALGSLSAQHDLAFSFDLIDDIDDFRDDSVGRHLPCDVSLTHSVFDNPDGRSRPRWEERDVQNSRSVLNDSDFDDDRPARGRANLSGGEFARLVPHHGDMFPAQLHSLQRDTGLQTISIYSDLQAHTGELVPSNPGFTLVDGLYDDDAWPVDDPRRSYDVVDFVDDWMSKAASTASCISKFSAKRENETAWFRQWPTSSLSPCRHPAHPDTDMQGIDWAGFGTTRSDALAARLSLHPSRRRPFYAQAHQIKPRPYRQDASQHYRFRSFKPDHRASFNHYQLRNVLAAHDRNSILFSSGSKVIQTSLASPMMSNTVLDLSKTANNPSELRITCLAATPSSSILTGRQHRILLAGGFQGEYAVVNLDSVAPTPHLSHVTHAYNGLVTHIETSAHRTSGQLQASMCCNDSKVRVLDLSVLQFIHDFSFDTAINASALSVDGRLRALVGDSDVVRITDAERGSTLVSLSEHRDHGFAVAWAPDGVHVATGAQDGQVIVWDARNWSLPVHRLDSTMSCARSLHFTHGSLLVAAESEDVVRIYDVKDPERCQNIAFFGSIAGMAVLDGGSELVVANADRTVGGLLSFELNGRGSTRDGFEQRAMSSRAWDMVKHTGNSFDECWEDETSI